MQEAQLLSDRETVLDVVGHDSQLPSGCKIAIVAAKQDSQLRSDRESVLVVVMHDGQLPPDREIAIEAAKQDGLAFRYAATEENWA